jgi:hypothetical protein
VNWEFWPWQIVYFPVILYYIWLAIKARSLFFFYSTNPGIESGGLLAESKNDILKLIPHGLKPKTLYFRAITGYDEVISALEKTKMHFPVICKPDYGERGWKVEKINDTHELQKYVGQIRIDFLIQEFIDKAIELGIFYIRMPNEEHGKITSIVQKELLCILGDGESTIREIMKRSPRNMLYLSQVHDRHPDLLNLVPDKGQKIELVPIGNHSRGTTFFNGNHLITEKLERTFDALSSKINGFYYGRFDIRCDNIHDLYEGKGFKILELNGAKSEPAHIYHPGFPILEAYKILIHHWNLIYQIAKINRENGSHYPSFREGWAGWRKFIKIRNARKGKRYQSKTSSPSASAL